MPDSPLVSTSELRDAAPHRVWLDARAGPDARAQYARGHLVGALFADLE